jgi:hypothetical protein
LAVTEEKPYDRAYGAREMHPFWYLRYHLSPGGGKVVCIKVLMRPKAERRANFPPPGEVVRSTQRGAFPSGEARLYGFPFRGAEL